ncbi:hypothetical protein FGO68_gene15204 [Halteria grandinella]|uniref:Uncharacterized protein n=1 Tax=Halteria grandinella TaxID=5974 RepID=A0A8J8TA50_HALGN|nr:hypothetical protein FGO68_gene15204 [Halteria grandinella]
MGFQTLDASFFSILPITSTFCQKLSIKRKQLAAIPQNTILILDGLLLNSPLREQRQYRKFGMGLNRTCLILRCLIRIKLLSTQLGMETRQLIYAIDQ